MLSIIIYAACLGIFALLGQHPKFVLLFYLGGVACLVLRFLIELPIRTFIIKWYSNKFSDPSNALLNQQILWSISPPDDPQSGKLWIRARSKLVITSAIGSAIIWLYVTAWTDKFFPDIPSAEAGLYWLFGILVWSMRLPEDAMTYLGLKQNPGEHALGTRTIFLEVKGTLKERTFATILGMVVAYISYFLYIPMHYFVNTLSKLL